MKIHKDEKNFRGSTLIDGYAARSFFQCAWNACQAQWYFYVSFATIAPSVTLWETTSQNVVYARMTYSFVSSL